MNQSEKNINTCLACGFKGEEEPFYIYIDETHFGQNEGAICPSCGYQPGVTDIDKGYSFKAWRHKWVEAGAQWGTIFVIPSKDWNAKDQLRTIGVILDDNNEIIEEPEDPIWHLVPTAEERGV